MTARLLINSAFHFASRFAALGLACSAILRRAKVLWANHFALWFAALHLATIRIEALATS
jgi:hypothetical protein